MGVRPTTHVYVNSVHIGHFDEVNFVEGTGITFVVTVDEGTRILNITVNGGGGGSHASDHEDGGADEINLALLSGSPAALNTHLGDPTDAHDASAISILDAGSDFTATDVEGALDELQADNEAHVAAADPHTGYRLESADHSHASAGAQGGTIDHGAITGLTDDDHTQYRLESADHTHQSTGAQAGTLDHGAALTGLGDDDHTQYILKSIVDADGDLIKGTAADTVARMARGAEGTTLRSTSSSVAWESPAFSVGALLEGAPPATGFRMIWRAPFACTVTNVRGHIDAGTSATINARKNQTSDFLSVDLVIVSADAWADGGAVQNTAIAAGDDIEIELVATVGSVTQVNIQVDLTRP